MTTAALAHDDIQSFCFDPPAGCPGSQITWHCGSDGQDPHFFDRSWRYEIFKAYPNRFSIALAHLYIEDYELHGRAYANSVLRYMHECLKKLNFKIATNEDALEKYSKDMTDQIRSFLRKNALNERRLFLLDKYIQQFGLKLPNKSENGIIKRLLDENWWRRNLRKKHRCSLERAAIYLNLVNKRKSIYISEESLNCTRLIKKRNNSILSNLIAKNELGEEFTLKEIQELTVSNPKIRRSELMVRVAGIERYAKETGHIGVLITLTCPGRMHRSLFKSGERNPNYDNSTPYSAQKYLNNVWARIRAKLNRENIPMYGMRVCEPHHDATPHWHILVFLRPQNFEAVRNIFTDYALADSPEEKGAKKRRIKFQLINWNKGTATGYIAKYISKNIDGFGLDQDDYANCAKSSADRVSAWASTWRIRQFQFFGTPPISQWRELRRLCPESIPQGILKDCCQAADSSDFYSYFKAMGGYLARTANYPVRLLKIWSDRLGKYGEEIGYQTIGLLFQGMSYISRIHTWTIEPRSISTEGGLPLTIGKSRLVNEVERASQGAALGGSPASTRRDRAPMSRESAPWSTVNNCTGVI